MEIVADRLIAALGKMLLTRCRWALPLTDCKISGLAVFCARTGLVSVNVAMSI